MTAPGGFDAYAETYDEALGQGLALSGEGKGYFARGRLSWLRCRLQALGLPAGRVLDFGCGTGATAPLFLEIVGASAVVGVDASRESIDRARRTFGAAQVSFQELDAYDPAQEFDLAFCNGVFHHVPPTERAGAWRWLHRALRPGGLLAFWENNPWNPGTRLVMRRIPFDRDAIPLAPPEARAGLRQAGFEVLRTDYLFVFPRALKWARPLEPRLARLPLGGQYQVLARKST